MPIEFDTSRAFKRYFSSSDIFHPCLLNSSYPQGMGNAIHVEVTAVIKSELI
jgi:hypothetical protein